MPEPIARLTVACPGRRPRRYRLGVGVYRIGRGRLVADLVVDEPALARVHAELRIRPRGASLRDLGRGSPVTVDGRELRDAAELEDGAEIAIGAVRLVLQHPGAGLDARLRAAGELSSRFGRIAAARPGPRGASPWPPALVSLALAVLLAALWMLG